MGKKMQGTQKKLYIYIYECMIRTLQLELINLVIAKVD
jgi:hypothetical protein